MKFWDYINNNVFTICTFRVKCPYCPVEQNPDDAKVVMFWDQCTTRIISPLSGHLAYRSLEKKRHYLEMGILYILFILSQILFSLWKKMKYWWERFIVLLDFFSIFLISYRYFWRKAKENSTTKNPNQKNPTC